MKLKYSGVVEAEPCPNSPGMYRITKGAELVPAGQVMRPEYMRANFEAADCESLDVLDPERMNRLCPPVINAPKRFFPPGIGRDAAIKH